MNILVVTREEFPYGTAASNHVLTYLPGIVAHGHSVTILCQFLTRKENACLLDKNGECFFEGIRIIYTGGRTPWPVGSRRYFTKFYLKYKAIIGSNAFFRKNHNKIDIVQMYSMDIRLYERFKKTCSSYGLKYIIERSELPDIVKSKEKFIQTKKGKEYIRRSEKAFALFDGWILETQTLLNYYSKFFNPDTKSILVPMTVDVDRFTIKKSENTRFGRYIAYCGNMCEIDGISILIRAYSIVRNKYPDIKLVLAGDSPEVPSQKQLAKELGVLDATFFLGRVSRDEVPQLLADASILVLASPSSDRASASMPCKVGEYLCTSNPVVVTGQGEIFKYLKDGESAFLAQPDSAEKFADKIEEVLANMPRSLAIGRRGRQVAINCFGSESQVIRIESFYKDLVQC